MPDRLILVDYENRQQVDMAVLDQSYRAIVFVGANQQPPKAAQRPATAHRFTRVSFVKVEGAGRNAADFHIAFYLGRVIETSPSTECFVLSGDKGFDPLLLHLNNNGMRCRRIETLEELVPAAQKVACRRCGKASTIEHHGGRWCINCGCFAAPPDPKLLPSNQPGYRDELQRSRFGWQGNDAGVRGLAECAWCHARVDMGDGIYDDGEWMCGGCVSRYAT